MRKIIIENWKMNPASEKEAEQLFKEAIASASLEIDTIIASPFIYLSILARIKRPHYIALAAQDVFWEESGAFTGEISPLQLKGYGVKYVIVGHSERRLNLGETDELIGKKVRAAHTHGIIPVLCIGETKKEKEDNMREAILKMQLEKGLALLAKNAEFLIAYEPVWAIGTGNPSTVEDTLEAVHFINRVLQALHKGYKVKFLYGGSITKDTVRDFLKEDDIHGVLMGKASLSPADFKEME